MKEIQITLSANSDFKLYFDSECPVCTSFVKLLKKKLDTNQIEYLPIENPDEIKEFRFIAFDNEFHGKEAIDELSRHFPEVLSYFWILPPQYRKNAAKKMYGFAGKIRSLYRIIVGRGCRKCNKKKKNS